MQKLHQLIVVASAAVFSAWIPLYADRPINTTCSVTASPNPVSQNATSTVTGTVVPDSGSVEGNGTITLRQHPNACKDVTFPGLGPVLGSGAPDASGQFSSSADTSVTGTYGLHNRYEGQGSGYAGCTSPCLDLVVSPDPVCPANGLNISATFASGEGTPPSACCSNWTFEITVQNCSGNTVHGVTAQGGTNGWTSASGTLLSPDMGSAAIRKLNNRSEVILWTIGDMAPGTAAHLYVKVYGCIKHGAPDGQVLFLSGPWSALTTDLPSPYNKTDYTGRVTITVDNTNLCTP